MKRIMIIAILAMPLSLIAQNTSLKGEIKNQYQDWVFLEYQEAVDYTDEEGIGLKKYVRHVVDSARLVNGKFEMEFQLDEFKELMFDDGNEHVTLYVSPGDQLQLKLNTKYFDETVRFTGKGAELNNIMATYYLVEEAKITSMYQRSWGVTEADTAVAMGWIKKVAGELNDYMTEMGNEFPAVAYKMKENAESIDKMLSRFPKQMKNSIDFAKMEKRVIGELFADVEGVNLEGKSVKLSDYYGNKAIVLDFWATWCGPCMHEMPYMPPIEKDFHSDVTVISVAVWDNLDKWKAKTPDLGFEHNIFIEKEESEKLRKPYLLNGIPRYVLLDKDGRIVSINAQRPSGGLREQLEAYVRSN